MVSITIKVAVPEEKQTEFLQTGVDIVRNARNETGCLEAHIHRDLENENSFHMVMEWESQSLIESFIRSRNFSALIGAMRFLSDTPDIRFDVITYSAGNEYIHQVRNKIA